MTFESRGHEDSIIYHKDSPLSTLPPNDNVSIISNPITSDSIDTSEDTFNHDIDATVLKLSQMLNNKNSKVKLLSLGIILHLTESDEIFKSSDMVIHTLVPILLSRLSDKDDLDNYSLCALINLSANHRYCQVILKHDIISNIFDRIRDQVASQDSIFNELSLLSNLTLTEIGIRKFLLNDDSGNMNLIFLLKLLDLYFVQIIADCPEIQNRIKNEHNLIGKTLINITAHKEGRNAFIQLGFDIGNALVDEIIHDFKYPDIIRIFYNLSLDTELHSFITHEKARFIPKICTLIYPQEEKCFLVEEGSPDKQSDDSESPTHTSIGETNSIDYYEPLHNIIISEGRGLIQEKDTRMDICNSLICLSRTNVGRHYLLRIHLVEILGVWNVLEDVSSIRGKISKLLQMLSTTVEEFEPFDLQR